MNATSRKVIAPEPKPTPPRAAKPEPPTIWRTLAELGALVLAVAAAIAVYIWVF